MTACCSTWNGSVGRNRHRKYGNDHGETNPLTDRSLLHMAQWSRGMIPASGGCVLEIAGGPGFDSRLSPLLFDFFSRF